MPSRLLVSLLLLIPITAVTAEAGLRQGARRLGGSFRLESFENETNVDCEVTVGILGRKYLEYGFVLGATKREGSTTFGKVGGNLLWHFLPDNQVVPGAGIQVTRTRGYPELSGENGNFTIGEVFGNVEAFVTPSWSLTFRGSYQSWWGSTFNARGFVFRVGFSTFWGGRAR